jgi:formate dehydrogenase subunit gamma
MDFVRRATNPWGEDVLLGLSWELFWVAVVAGAIFVVVHAFFARKVRGREAAARPLSGGAPEKVERHGRSARISHWVLAAAVLALLVTAFVPILGLQFPWVTIHWIAGVVLTAYLLYHVVDTVRRRTLGTMWIGGEEVRESGERLRHFVGKRSDPGPKPGKWALENKVFHHLTALAGIAVIGTGLFMMFRVDTWFWEANPYILGVSDGLWGWIYVLHGLASVGFVGLLMAHIYFAVRPDKLWITRSMFRGWITREEYLTHHDPGRWPSSGSGRQAVPRPAESAPHPERARVGFGTSSSGSGMDGPRDGADG